MLTRLKIGKEKTSQTDMLLTTQNPGFTHVGLRRQDQAMKEGKTRAEQVWAGAENDLSKFLEVVDWRDNPSLPSLGMS